jgi:Trm5-related predicted tRNA methylase
MENFLKTEETERVLPEQKLWQAVLYQSIHDSVFGDYKSVSTAREKEEAKEWLNIDNEGFKEVCENAGFNPHFVYKSIIKFMKGKVKTNVR